MNRNSTKIQIWRFTVQKQLVHTVAKKEVDLECGGLGKGTPYCFFNIHFNSLEDEWTYFQNTSHTDQPEVMAGMQELSETWCHEGGS